MFYIDFLNINDDLIFFHRDFSVFGQCILTYGLELFICLMLHNLFNNNKIVITLGKLHLANIYLLYILIIFLCEIVHLILVCNSEKIINGFD